MLEVTWCTPTLHDLPVEAHRLVGYHTVTGKIEATSFLCKSQHNLNKCRRSIN